ncbi:MULTISPECIES: FISUMP domain-containing protein [unclassified Fibrobacter]|uniref:FISUMP domain-containing protein n=1 Tax=unclassified Fibrobacter TaxID=2634177 RepID=UPI000D6B8113|nr:MULTISPECIES: FISUMP domain-containing protein [unclassified Fibrobacter]PWJ57516.1 uncharacterized protein (TIGR02145 family) [Fibrobacter sp. UWR4]PZW62736.1 uncharacterized protein (TIGR02145 family) [Fibrobacter sp. UWR1]
MTKYLFMLSIAAVMFVACGGDNGSSANDDEIDSSSSSAIQSSSSDVKYSSSSVKSSSSSDVILSGGSAAVEESSSSSVVKSSSSSAKSSSSSAKSSSSSAKSSSSSVKVSSSSEYKPFDHKKTLAGVYEVGVDAYKQFTDERNGRSYYYITITGKDTSNKENTVTVMAENLNVGDFVWGFLDQEEDSKIERYCYGDDTTKCDRYGGLYQWAEMMQLPSRCNTESCADLIQENHQGICPEGWRLLTYNDFHTVYHSNTNVASPLVKGLRSSYFGVGSNYSGYSLLGGGMRVTEGNFINMGLAETWFYPEEYIATEARANQVTNNNVAPRDYDSGYKTDGFFVRCVKLETEE